MGTVFGIYDDRNSADEKQNYQNINSIFSLDPIVLDKVQAKDRVDILIVLFFISTVSIIINSENGGIIFCNIQIYRAFSTFAPPRLLSGEGESIDTFDRSRKYSI